MSLVQQLIAAQPQAAKPKREKPKKVGFCVRHNGVGNLRFNRWSTKGEPVFNNYCEECHRAYMAEYRKKYFVGRVRVGRPEKIHAD